MDYDWIDPSPVISAFLHMLQYISPRGDKSPTLVRI